LKIYYLKSEKNSLEVYLACVFIILITSNQFLQLIFDSFKIKFPIYLLTGYLFCHLIGFYFLKINFYILKKKLIQNRYIIFFIIYSSLLCIFSGGLKEFIGYYIFKDGLINWFLIGNYLFFIISTFVESKDSLIFKRIKKIFLFYFIILGISYIFYGLYFIDVYQYLNGRPYQRMSINFYINFLIIFPIFKIFFNTNKYRILLFAFYSIALIVTYINIIALSNAAPFYYLSLIFCSVIPVDFYSFRIFLKYIFYSVVSLLGFILLSNSFTQGTSIFEDIIYENRFGNTLNLDFQNVKPFTSRLDIIKDFPNQFMVSPIFGGWYPEIKSGIGLGYYAHSMLLSIITHTGIVGLSLFLFGILKVSFSRLKNLNNKFFDLNNFFTYQIFATFLLASISYFFIFPPFWFLIGISIPGVIQISESN
tara:strand:+ start:19888 stop:21150 length:1263 start_codon:yes stop_codon:yes gene_type:complete